MDICRKTIVNYYIIFTESSQNHWLLKRLKREFQHVLAIKKSVGGHYWIVINPLFPYTLVDIIPVLDYPDIRTLLNGHKYKTVMTVKAEVNIKERYTLCIINCVEIIKSLLGIRAFWVWTPYQLYKYLKKHGGKHG